MRKFYALHFAVALAFATASTGAFAHALLDHASPGVGSTVSGSPREIALSFTQNLVAGFSGAKLVAAGGGAVPLGKAVVAPGEPQTMHLSVGRALKPGGYTVEWHAVSVDTHRTSGAYRFTVAP